MQTKPRDHWTNEDLLDYLEGWHAASGLNYRPQRDPQRVIHMGPGVPHSNAAALMALGADERGRHRVATGI